jgi:predicted DNA-binding transcriptional regulator AlpA
VQTHPTAAERLTICLEEACQILGVGRTLGYELARRGEFPGCLRLGGRYVVSRPMLHQHLGLPWPPPTGSDTTDGTPEAA